jgi:pyruvate dehydrogenase E2 component (dihydrolipoamide acetyltransferase)
MTEIVIPSAGIAMEEAMVVKWHKAPGDAVAADEPVVEIETDKATMDVVSPIAGRLGPHLAEPGDVVPVGAAIARVLTEEAAAEQPHAPEPDELPPLTGASAASTDEREQEPAATDGESGDAHSRTPHALSPRARRLERERASQPPQAAPSQGRFRGVIATKVAESWREIPHFTVSSEIDAEQMSIELEQERARGTEPLPSFTDMLLRALAEALQENGAEGAIDLGLAVATPDGVVVPVVQDVLGQTLSQLAAARQAAVARARNGRLAPEDLNVTPVSTLSNLGSFGVDRFTGIVALGQTTLLTVGRARPRVVADDRRAISVRLTFDATVNSDHRALDGADAARLLSSFAAAVERTTSAT